MERWTLTMCVSSEKFRTARDTCSGTHNPGPFPRSLFLRIYPTKLLSEATSIGWRQSHPCLSPLPHPSTTLSKMWKPQAHLWKASGLSALNTTPIVPADSIDTSLCLFNRLIKAGGQSQRLDSLTSPQGHNLPHPVKRLSLPPTEKQHPSQKPQRLPSAIRDGGAAQPWVLHPSLA